MLQLRPDQVADHLIRCVYTRIGPSPIQGIGVFAIRDIPKGIDPFSERELGLAFIKVSADLIERDPRIPEGVKQYVRDISSKKNGVRNFPAAGFNTVSASFLMNHADENNIGHDQDGFPIALRTIRAGEELTLNYGTFNDVSELEFDRLHEAQFEYAAA